MTTTPRVNRRTGTLLTLVPATAAAAFALGVTPAQASPAGESATAATPLTLVQTHTWAQTASTMTTSTMTTGARLDAAHVTAVHVAPAHVDAAQATGHLVAANADVAPAGVTHANVALGSTPMTDLQPHGTWIDGVHGPVLDGALLSTPMLVALLLGVAALALFMAGRASSASSAPAEGGAR